MSWSTVPARHADLSELMSHPRWMTGLGWWELLRRALSLLAAPPRRGDGGREPTQWRLTDPSAARPVPDCRDHTAVIMQRYCGGRSNYAARVDSQAQEAHKSARNSDTRGSPWHMLHDHGSPSSKRHADHVAELWHAQRHRGASDQSSTGRAKECAKVDRKGVTVGHAATAAVRANETKGMGI